MPAMPAPGVAVAPGAVPAAPVAVAEVAVTPPPPAIPELNAAQGLDVCRCGGDVGRSGDRFGGGRQCRTTRQSRARDDSGQSRFLVELHLLCLSVFVFPGTCAAFGKSRDTLKIPRLVATVSGHYL